MINAALSLGALFSLFAVMLLSAMIGRRYGQWQLKVGRTNKLFVVSVAEGAVFALLGLLVAFTFTGAYERFDARKALIIEEANAIDTAYLRIAILAPSTQKELRQHFRDYLDLRLSAYHELPDIYAAEARFNESLVLQKQIWHEVLEACKITNNQAVTQLVVPSFNSVFEIANTRFAVTRIHPPLIIFILLVGLAMLSAFLAGYSTAENNVRNSIHILSYVVIMAFILYVIIDLETPRLGLITVTDFDEILSDARVNMNN